ncbi:MAG: hypothetical protein FJ218_06980 [Ignavibacteria bacterium]|nr:hypothetical protein [Ignavibacteria bacterium]
MSRKKRINSYVSAQVSDGNWRKETIPASELGTIKDMEIYRASRKDKFIKHNWHGDRNTFCPPVWYDLAIGSGACGYQCRFCFLMLTFRAMRDPRKPLVYDNIYEFENEVRKWLLADEWETDWKDTQGNKRGRIRRTSKDTLGLGIDCADSLLFEGVTGHARRYIPLFADPTTNPRGNKLILLTKSANTHYLQGLPTQNVVVTFSLNPERIADLWEGKYADTGERITPPIEERLQACLQAQNFGYETRFRIDPILTPENWREDYIQFFNNAAKMGLTPTRITLGTYREVNSSLDQWRKKWHLVAPEWQPDTNDLIKEGTHFHVSTQYRETVYRDVIQMIDNAPWKVKPGIELCKEPFTMRKNVGLKECYCNCL